MFMRRAADGQAPVECEGGQPMHRRPAGESRGLHIGRGELLHAPNHDAVRIVFDGRGAAIVTPEHQSEQRRIGASEGQVSLSLRHQRVAGIQVIVGREQNSAEIVEAAQRHCR